jgi:hypothetical protein
VSLFVVFLEFHRPNTLRFEPHFLTPPLLADQQGPDIVPKLLNDPYRSFKSNQCFWE